MQHANLSPSIPTAQPVTMLDADLLSLGDRFRAAVREDLILEHATFPPPASIAARQRALGDEIHAIAERAHQLRATTQAGLRIKALMLAHALLPLQDEGYDSPEQQLARSLLADILGWPAVDMNDAQHAAFWRAEGYWPSDNDDAADAELQAHLRLLATPALVAAE